MILTNQRTFPSAKLLRDTIEEKTGIHLACTSDPKKLKGKILHVRFGNSTDIPDSVKDTEFNDSKFIRLVSNKIKFSNMLLENSINSPIFSKDIPSEDDFPLFIRKTLSSYGGKGIVPCKNIDEFINNGGRNYYWTKFIPTSSEYRVHVLGGEVMKIQKKVFSGEVEPEFPIRNLENNYHFSLRENYDKFPKLLEVITELNKIITGKFYSLDIGYSKILEKYFIFEGNSASGMNENTSNIYAEYLIDKIF